MIYLKGHLARPLDAALSAPSRLAVLRVLSAARAPLSGRAIARMAGINHQGASVALGALAALGLVERRPAGRSDQWRLDRRRWLVSEVLVPLLERETEHAEGVVQAVQAALKGAAVAVLVSGQAAKGRLAPGKPLELIVVEGAPGRRRIAESLRSLKATLDERWGLALDARVLSKREALTAVAVEDLWELLPREGPPSYFAGPTAQR